MEKKPPIGIKPEWLHKEQRLAEIRGAIQRYLDADQPIPVNWIAEEYAIRLWLENREVEKERNNVQNFNKSQSSNPSNTIEQSTGKDWDIVSVTHFEGKPSDKKQGDHVSWSGDSEPKWHLIPQLLQDELTKIHSVKRLSDASTWSVGQDSYWGIIKGFEIVDGKMQVLYAAKGDWQWLSSIAPPKSQSPTPSKQPLFITEVKWQLIEGNPTFPCLFVPIEFKPQDEYNWEKAFMTECKIRGAGRYFKIKSIKCL